jgi:Uma2 family endonuclease
MIATSSMSFAEFEQLPDAPGKRELIDGELIELPPARLSHNTLAHKFHSLLVSALSERSVWIEMGYRIGGGWFQPDVSISYPEQQVANDYFVGAPLLALEILSPSNTAAQLDRKLALYFEEALVRYGWSTRPIAP